jgi:integrase
MPRKLRPAAKIGNRADRLNLPHRRAPYGLSSIGPGIRLGYRRTKSTSGGRWVFECADGHGGEWQRVVGIADDFEDADGEHVLTFWQAADKARAMVRGSSTNAPVTWAQALYAYETDLKARGGSLYNASRVRHHLRASAPALLVKPVALLGATELAHWRDALVASKLKPASVVRILKGARASLNLAANRDPRIRNRDAWRVGFGGLHDAYQPTNRVVSDDIVRRIVAEAAALDADFGLFIRVAAETGARASQIARLVVADLHDGAEPRLSMPSSRKGKHRAISRRPVPISPDLAARLASIASDRPADGALLLRNGTAWNLLKSGKRLLQEPFAIIAARAGVPGTTMYALRHSSIVRSLLGGVPAQLVASNHDTSLAMLAKTYARYISDFGSDAARRALLDVAPATSPNVVTLPTRATGH